MNIKKYVLKKIFSLIKLTRKVHRLITGTRQSKASQSLWLKQNPDIIIGEEASNVIKDFILSDKPGLIGRLGGHELGLAANYKGVNSQLFILKKILLYSQNKLGEFWWDSDRIMGLCYDAGFFPSDIENIEKYTELCISEMSEIDILASLFVDEKVFKNELSHCKKIEASALNPIFQESPWTIALKGKKVLIVSPFVETIKTQYKNRKLLFRNQNILPDFHLKTVKAVLSIANNKTEFKTWFDALESMKKNISEVDFDVALLSCGAYGMPLCTHIKKMGKKSIYIGGNLQLLFGIKGARWMQWERYRNLFNEHWVFPSIEETPISKNDIQDGIKGGAYFGNYKN